MTIENNVVQVTQTIAEAVEHSVYDHTPEVIVVTKTQSFEDISKLYELGYRHFGENRVDALRQRQAQFPQGDIIWHLIGTLQTRKVKDIINHIDFFHALDRWSVIDEIDKRATKIVSCFLQVNAFNEPSKHGFSMAEVEDVLAYVQTKRWVRIVGLMVMAPIDAREAILYQTFQDVKQLQQCIEQKNKSNCPCHYLSMGMSLDYKIAVQCGATHLRIGSAFFKT